MGAREYPTITICLMWEEGRLMTPQSLSLGPPNLSGSLIPTSCHPPVSRGVHHQRHASAAPQTIAERWPRQCEPDTRGPGVGPRRHCRRGTSCRTCVL